MNTRKKINLNLKDYKKHIEQRIMNANKTIPSITDKKILTKSIILLEKLKREKIIIDKFYEIIKKETSICMTDIINLYNVGRNIELKDTGASLRQSLWNELQTHAYNTESLSFSKYLTDEKNINNEIDFKTVLKKEIEFLLMINMVWYEELKKTR